MDADATYFSNRRKIEWKLTANALQTVKQTRMFYLQILLCAVVVLFHRDGSGLVNLARHYKSMPRKI